MLRLLNRLGIILLSSWLAMPALAHEFWLSAEKFITHPNATARLRLHVGEQFAGEQVGFGAAYIARMRMYSETQTRDLRARLPAGVILPELDVHLGQAGTYLIAYDSQPNLITLPADKFHAYLREEGLEHIIRRRAAIGASGKPGRERYIRNVKTLLQAGDAHDTGFARETGQRLEMIPLTQPMRYAVGSAFAVRLLFDRKPLAGALVKAWHKDSGKLVTVQTRSDRDGKITLRLPHAGAWMISTVHMIATSKDSEADWESYWGNLSFAIPAPAN